MKFKLLLCFLSSFVLFANLHSMDDKSRYIASVNSLISACLEGDCAQVKHRIDSGADVNVKFQQKKTLLHYAAHDGNLDMVKALLAKGAFHCSDSQGFTPLHYAVAKGHKDVVQELLKNKKVVGSLKRYTTNSPLFSAVSNGRDEIVSLLVKAGAKVKVSDKEGRTLLHIVATSGNIKIFNILKQFIDTLSQEDKTKIVNTVDKKYRHTALHCAASKGHFELAKELLCMNADPKIKDVLGALPIHCAASCGSVEIINVLLSKISEEERNAYINAKVAGNTTPLHNAVRCGKASVVDFLVSEGADVDVIAFGQTPLECIPQNLNQEIAGEIKYILCKHVDISYFANELCSIIRRGDIGELDEFLKTHSDKKDLVNTPDKNEIMPLDCAVNRGNIKCVQTLIDAGAALDRLDGDGRSLFHRAVCKKRTAIIELLLSIDKTKKLLDVREKKEGYTPLHYAAMVGDSSIVRMLIKAGANIDIADKKHRKPLHLSKTDEVFKVLLGDIAEAKDSVDKFGYKPIHLAARYGFVSAIQNLLAAKANIRSECSRGKMALDYASEKKQLSLLQFLDENLAELKRKELSEKRTCLGCEMSRYCTGLNNCDHFLCEICLRTRRNAVIKGRMLINKGTVHHLEKPKCPKCNVSFSLTS